MKIESILKQVTEKNHSAFFYTPSIYKRSYSYLFINPSKIVTASTVDEINEALKKISKRYNRGLLGYGLIDYETGYAFEKKLLNYFPNNGKPVLSFFFFDKENVKVINSSKIVFTYNDEDNYEINSFRLNTSPEDFCKAVNKIRNYIAEGDTYQVNYTVKGKFNYSGIPENIFKMLVFNQSAKYTAFINKDDEIIISVSPELFFHLEGNRIKTKPMKGTTKRGLNTAQDHLQEYQLRNSNKERAENLMIVDLLRNDLGRISEFSSVKVKEIFKVEKYESLFQMVSVIQSKINRKVSFADIIKSLFPCGSITGAPKISTMKIINELEAEKRGIYTGTIGLIKQSNNSASVGIQSEAVFNIAIRTIILNKNTKEGEIGLGSGIVWDSNPIKEYEETLLKSNFFTKPVEYFDLIETMKFENGKIFLFDEHIERLKNASDYFLFLFQEKKIRRTIEKVLLKLDINKKYRIRLKLNKWGKINFDINELKNELGEIKIIISSKTINSNNNFQYFKTTNRELYNDEYDCFSGKGFFDVIFINEKNHVAEGAISNIFLNKGGMLYTPPVSSGVLPGVYRKYFLQNNLNVKEEILYKDDLLIADEIILTNSVRGKIKVDKLYLNETEYKQF